MANKSSEKHFSTPRQAAIPIGHLMVNPKWKGTQLANLLQNATSINYLDSTEVADFRIANQIAIIFLTEAEIVAGNAYRRSLVKLRKAKNVHGIVLVEKTSFTEQYFQAIQKFTVLELGLSLIPISSVKEAAQMLSQMVNAESRSPKDPFKLRSQECLEEKRLAFVKQIPNVGAIKAKLLLEKFKSIQNICNASQDEMNTILGKRCSAEINKFVMNQSTK